MTNSHALFERGQRHAAAVLNARAAGLAGLAVLLRRQLCGAQVLTAILDVAFARRAQVISAQRRAP